MGWNRKELNKVMEDNQDKSWPPIYALLPTLGHRPILPTHTTLTTTAAAADAPVPLPSMMRQLLGHYKFSQARLYPKPL